MIGSLHSGSGVWYHFTKCILDLTKISCKKLRFLVGNSHTPMAKKDTLRSTVLAVTIRVGPLFVSNIISYWQEFLLPPIPVNCRTSCRSLQYIAFLSVTYFEITHFSAPMSAKHLINLPSNPGNSKYMKNVLCTVLSVPSIKFLLQSLQLITLHDCCGWTVTISLSTG